LAVEVIDSHCHLDIAYDQTRHGPALGVDEALRYAADVGVTRVVNVGYDLDSSRFSVGIAESHENVVAAVALHPNEAPRLAERGIFDGHFAAIEELAKHERVRAVGETGLDYYRTPPAGREAQEVSFRQHIELAKRRNLTLVIHDRDAHDDVVRVLLEEGPPERIVFHCFSGDVALVATCAEHGWYMSFAGPVTFKANDSLRVALLTAPDDLLLVETDAPFLAPFPHRGKPNASYLIPVTLRTMSQVRDVDENKLAETVSGNTLRAFGSW
jgi:TatD DNase family protein